MICIYIVYISYHMYVYWCQYLFIEALTALLAVSIALPLLLRSSALTRSLGTTT